MPLESLQPRKKIDVRKVALESPEKGRQDPFSEVSAFIKDHWDDYARYLSGMDHPEMMSTYADALRNAAMACPDCYKQSEMNTMLPDNIKSDLINTGEVFQRTEYNFFEAVISSKVLMPEEYNDFVYKIQEFENYKNKLAGPTDAAYSADYIKAFGMRLAFPERIKELTLSKEKWLLILSHIKAAKESKDYKQLVNNLCFIKLLWPEKLATIPLNDSIWQELDKPINEFGGEGWDWMQELEYINMLKILKAKDIRTTNKGVEFVMPRKIEDRSTKNLKPPIKKDF